MRQLIIGLLFVTVAIAQIPDTTLESFEWPNRVAKKMVKITDKPSQTVVLTQDEHMAQGYDVISQKLYEKPTVRKGTSVEVWRLDHRGKRYFLLTDGPGWFWTTLPVAKQTQKRSDPISVKFQYDYWNVNYGEKIEGSRISGYLNKSFHYQTGLGNFTISPGFGLSVRYRPTSQDPSLYEMIPMYRYRLNLDWRYKPLSWYVSGSQYVPFEDVLEDIREVYSKLSWQLPSFVRNWRINFAYYGKQPINQSWLYGEGKVQVIYTYKKWWFGIEPYVAARWENTGGWVTQSRSRSPGNLVIGAWINEHWFEVNYGRYHKESGLAPKISREENEDRISFAIGIKL